MNARYHRENVLTALAKAAEAMGDNPEGLRHLADLKRLIDAPPNTTVTVALDADPRGVSVSVGVWQGSQCIYTGAHALPAPADRTRDWKAINAAIDEYLDGYELRLDEGCLTPTEFERFLLDDAIAGLLDDDEFITALYATATAGRAAPAAGDAQILAALQQAHMALIGFMPQHRNAVIVAAIVAAHEAIDAATAAQRGDEDEHIGTAQT